MVEGGCSKRRPDLLFDMGSHVVVVEVDEIFNTTRTTAPASTGVFWRFLRM